MPRHLLPCLSAVLAALALVWSGSPVDAQTATGKKYALLVGVLKYDHASLPDLEHTERDADELAELLQKPSSGFTEVVVLTTNRGKKNARFKPTAKNIREQLKRLSDKVTKHDMLLIGLAGHGLQITVQDPITKKDREENFFCPADAKPRETKNLAELQKTMIPLGELFKELQDSGAGARLLLVDACRNELEDARGRNPDVDTVPRPAKGTAALFSCKSGEKAYETKVLGKAGHGVFFHYVIEGLKGKASNSKGQVTWGGLTEYVSDNVSSRVPMLIGGGAKQTPHEVKNLEGIAVLLGKVPDNGQRLYLQARKYAQGRGGLEPDAKKAFELYETAAGSGHVEAMHQLGVCYREGKGVKRNDRKAVEWLSKAAEKENASAMNSLGWMHKEGLGGLPKDDREAVKWFHKAAEMGEQWGMYNLALMYASGRAGEKNDAEAVKWYRRAADKGNTPAAYSLGLMYATGRAGEKNLEEAARLYQSAADKGHVQAMAKLGLMYARAQGVKRDYKRAVHWLSKAADQNVAAGQNGLGVMYEHGWGVDQSHKKAIAWYRKAVEQNEPNAMVNLALMYLNGRGVEKTQKRAVQKEATQLLHKAAAEHKLPEAQYYLGLAYEKGAGVDKNKATALKWYGKAADRGYEAAKKKVRELRK